MLGGGKGAKRNTSEMAPSSGICSQPWIGRLVEPFSVKYEHPCSMVICIHARSSRVAGFCWRRDRANSYIKPYMWLYISQVHNTKEPPPTPTPTIRSPCPLSLPLPPSVRSTIRHASVLFRSIAPSPHHLVGNSLVPSSPRYTHVTRILVRHTVQYQ